MELLLETKCYVIDGKPYFRIHLKRKQSDALGLQKDDKILVEIKEIIRPEGETNNRYQLKLIEATD